jgi:hypothetical protein
MRIGVSIADEKWDRTQPVQIDQADREEFPVKSGKAALTRRPGVMP